MAEKLEEILQTSPDYDRSGRKIQDSYNPFGRVEALNQTLVFRLSPQAKQRLIALQNWAEVVRVVLEEDLASGRFFLRQPQPKPRGRGGDGSGADVQIIIRVSESFKERITAVARWQARAREALYDALEKLAV